MSGPTISLVTPSLDQGAYLEQALRSVLDQDYPALEYVVADGGSTDGSERIVARYADRLTAWWSEPDGGHANALNRAFARTTGDVMGWLNADDVLLPRALHVVGEIFESLPHVDWLTASYLPSIDPRGRLVLLNWTQGFHRDVFFAGLHGVARKGRQFTFIQQDSTFWRRSLWERAGGRLDESREPAADFELWSRFFEDAELYTVDTALSAFRFHGMQRSRLERERYFDQAHAVLAARGSATPGAAARALLRLRPSLPPGLVSRLRLGWDVPYLTWDHDAQRWLERRRLLA